VKAPALPTRTNGAAAAKKEKGKPVFDSTGSPLPLPVQIGTHIRTRGDMNFANVPWAGRVAPGLWIESFAVLPLEHFGPQDIEYKGLTGSGFETPWMSDNQMCGTKGMATPLVGFAIRLKPSPAAAAFDCEYSGYFQSGITVGPLRNGAPCRSSVANDSLEGIQVRIVKRASATVPEAARKGDSKDAVASKPMVAKPVVRKPAVTKAVPPKRSSTIAHHTANRNSRSTRRQPARRP
jgi:hypothetical protein